MPSLEIRKKGRDNPRIEEWHNGSVTLGRSSSNEVVLHNTSISRHHCTIERAGDRWKIRDLQSRHGFKINGVRRTEAILEDGDRLHVGPYELIFHEMASSESETAPPRPEAAAPAARAEEPSVDILPRDEPDAALAELREEFDRLEEALAHAKNDAESARAEAAALRALQQDEPASSERRMRSETDEAMSVHRDLELRVRTLEDELRAAKGEVAQGASSLASSAAEIERLRAAFPESKFVAPTIDTARARALEQATAPADGQTRPADAHVAPDRSNRHIEEQAVLLNDLRADFETAKRAAQVFESQLSDALAAGTAADERVRELLERIAELEGAREADFAQLERAGAERDLLAQREALLESFRAQLAEQTTANESLRGRLTAVEEAAAVLRAEAARNDELLHEAQSNCETMLDERNSHSAQSADLEARSRDLQSRLDASEAAHGAAIDRLREETSSTIARLEGDRDALRGQVSDLTAERELLRAEKSRLEESLGAAATLAVAISNAPEESQEDSPAVRQRITEMETARDEAETHARDAQQRLALARQNIDQFRRGIADVQKDRDVWASRARLAQSQLEAARKEAADARQHAREYETLLVDYVSQLQQSGQIDAAVVEMSPDEIRRAQREGAMVVELESPRK